MRKALFLAGILLLSASLSIAESAMGARAGKREKAKEVHAVGMAKVRVATQGSFSSSPERVIPSRVEGRGVEKPLDSSPALSAERAGASLEENTLLPIVSEPDILPEDQIFLDTVLRSLPALCTKNLEQVVVRYTKNAERGQATATTMLLRGPLATLSGHEKREMAAVIVHELCGHGADLGALQGTPQSGESAYPDGHIATYNDDPSVAFYAISWKNAKKRRPEARKEDFVTGYAMKDPFEDAAESAIYFALQEQAFRERAAKNPVLAAKLRWIETYVFTEGRGLALGTSWNGSIPWDATKVAYEISF